MEIVAILASQGIIRRNILSISSFKDQSTQEVESEDRSQGRSKDRV